jgi:hypothetical protein
MKDKVLKLVETEVSLTLGGFITNTSTDQSRLCSHGAGCVAWTDAPACMCV